MKTILITILFFVLLITCVSPAWSRPCVAIEIPIVDTVTGIPSCGGGSVSDPVAVSSPVASPSFPGPVTYPLGPDIKKVTLTASWTSSKGQPMSESITTYVSRKGLNGQ